MSQEDMQKKFEALAEKLTKRRTNLFLVLLEESKGYEKKIKQARKEMERNFMLGLEEEVKINKEELQIYGQSFSKNLHEMNILMNLLYGNHKTFEYN
jgi:CDP-glycerol glycerophosphotransferase (TagB/SpsB family)